MKSLIAATMAVCLALPAAAEPIGKWWTGFGQGTFEYGIKNDSRGSDMIYIACAEDRTYVSLTVGGVTPKPGSTTIVTIGADEFELFGDRDGYLATDSRVGYDNFRSLWKALRKGQSARVRLQSGQSTVFTLSGAAKVLGPQPCETDFERVG